MKKVRRAAPAPAGLGTEVIAVPEGSDLDLDLRIESVMEGVLVSGAVRGTAVGECVRCLDEVRVATEADLQELYVYPGRAPQGEDRDELDELRELEGDLVDLAPALYDTVVPALPFRPLCSPDCPGLCAECGARLAEEPGHSHTGVDPRWAALQAVLEQDAPTPADLDPTPVDLDPTPDQEPRPSPGQTHQIKES